MGFFSCCASCQIPALQLPWSNGRQRHVATIDGGVDVSADQKRSQEGSTMSRNNIPHVRFTASGHNIMNIFAS